MGQTQRGPTRWQREPTFRLGVARGLVREDANGTHWNVVDKCPACGIGIDRSVGDSRPWVDERSAPVLDSSCAGNRVRAGRSPGRRGGSGASAPSRVSCGYGCWTRAGRSRRSGQAGRMSPAELPRLAVEVGGRWPRRCHDLVSPSATACQEVPASARAPGPAGRGRLRRARGRPASAGCRRRGSPTPRPAGDLGQHAGEPALALVVDRARQAHGRAPDPQRGETQDRRDRPGATSDRSFGRQRVGLSGDAARHRRGT